MGRHLLMKVDKCKDLMKGIEEEEVINLNNPTIKYICFE